MSRWHRSARLALLLSLCPASLVADRLYLRNGQVVEGIIERRTKAEVQIRTRTGTVLIPKGTIKRFLYSDAEEDRRLSGKASETEPDEAPIPPGSVWRSAVLPGWGQCYANRTAACGLWMGGFASALYYAFTRRELAARSQSAYESTTGVGLAAARLFAAGAGGGDSTIQGLLAAEALQSRARNRYRLSISEHRSSLAMVFLVYFGQLAEVFWGSRAAGGGPGAVRWKPVLVAAPILGEPSGLEVGAAFRF